MAEMNSSSFGPIVSPLMAYRARGGSAPPKAPAPKGPSHLLVIIPGGGHLMGALARHAQEQRKRRLARGGQVKRFDSGGSSSTDGTATDPNATTAASPAATASAPASSDSFPLSAGNIGDYVSGNFPGYTSPDLTNFQDYILRGGGAYVPSLNINTTQQLTPQEYAYISSLNPTYDPANEQGLAIGQYATPASANQTPTTPASAVPTGPPSWEAAAPTNPLSAWGVYNYAPQLLNPQSPVGATSAPSTAGQFKFGARRGGAISRFAGMRR